MVATAPQPATAWQVDRYTRYARCCVSFFLFSLFGLIYSGIIQYIDTVYSVWLVMASAVMADDVIHLSVHSTH